MRSSDDEAGREPEVLIIGGGVNGAGVFRDLCEQGVRCLLLERHDYGSGTSAAPSRLIHGGLKYLETGEFRLVRESAHERNRLLRNAPHLVRPLETWIPIFSWTRGIGAALRTLAGSTTAPRSRGALLVKLALFLYDRFGSRERAMPRHRLVARHRALAALPGLTRRIVAAGCYHDASITAPERLVYELVADARAANPDSLAMNHVRLLGRRGDVIEFERHTGERALVRPRVVVNAAGPWIDRVNATLGVDTHYIGGTKGSHILLDHPDLIERLSGRMLYFEADDGRICLVFDYLGRALVGSTDTPADDPDSVCCEEHEIDYFLGSLRMLMPELDFRREQVVYTYSGIRPLPASDAGDPGMISRDHSVPVVEADGDREFPILSLVGGKWTTFRAFAEAVTTSVLDRLDCPRRVSTASLPIGGGRGFPTDASARAAWMDRMAHDTDCSHERLATLLDRYGTTAASIARYECTWPDEERLRDAVDYSVAEIAWIAAHEQVVTLEDLVLRRTTLAVTGRLARPDLERIGEVTGSVLDWSMSRIRREIDELVACVSERHLTRLPPGS